MKSLCHIWDGDEFEERRLEIEGNRAIDKARGEAYALTRGPASQRKGDRRRRVHVLNKATVASWRPGDKEEPLPPEPGLIRVLTDRVGLTKTADIETADGEARDAGASADLNEKAGNVYLADDNGELVLHRLTPGLFFAHASEAAHKALLARLKIPLWVWVTGGCAGAGVMYFLQPIIIAAFSSFHH